MPSMLELFGSAAAILAGAVTTTALVVESLRFTSNIRKKEVAPPCNVCNGKGFYLCKLCKGNSTIRWSPLDDPIAINPCVCPTCDGNRVQRCLNCLGKGNILKRAFILSNNTIVEIQVSNL